VRSFIVYLRKRYECYALGGPEHSAIVLTEGLLRGMTREEIAGILAHEVALSATMTPGQ